MASLTPLNTLSICSSSSVRSVTINTRAFLTCSRIHLVSHTMTRLFPLPCVCQMIPPSRRPTWVLAAPHTNGHDRALQFQHAERDSVDVDYYVRPFGVRLSIPTWDGAFLGDCEVILCWMVPNDEPDIYRVVTPARLLFHATTHEV